MKKILSLALLLTSLSLSTFASAKKEQKINLFNKIEGVSCYAGSVSCGTYMICFETPVERDIELEIAINEFFEEEFCGNP